ncbi:MAG: restriction endonuclease [Rhodocyclaceae bacterium]|nr:restriction endonuclease [Rhodocyclaceae bacterium]
MIWKLILVILGVMLLGKEVLLTVVLWIVAAFGLLIVIFFASAWLRDNQHSKAINKRERQPARGSIVSDILIFLLSPKNFYAQLDLQPDASKESIISRCLELGRKYHPDIHGNDAEMMKRFDETKKAYRTLSSPFRRGLHDLKLHLIKWSIESESRALAQQERLETKRQAAINLASQNFQTALSRLNAIVDKHSSDLLRKRRQLILDKGYGIVDRSGWESEMDFFFNAIAVPKLGKDAILVSSESRVHIDRQLNQILRRNNVPTKAPSDGVDFEHQCALMLEQNGWSVSTTKASGDQGADIVARMDSLSVVLQCKLYSKPVGNAAVQEAFAAKSHYGTRFAGVVTKSSYTKSAMTLAASTEVLLLHFEDLPNLQAMLRPIARN